MDSHAINKLPKNIKSSITTIIEAIKETTPDAEVYLFGSFAKDTWLEDSDIDLIIVSNKFKDIDYLSRIFTIKKAIHKRRKYRIHVIPLTHEELEERKRHSVIIRDAMKYAKRIL